jgi:RNA ligase
MHYSTRIEDYLDAIEGSDAFAVIQREYGTVINYRMLGNDVFPDPLTAPDEVTAHKWRLRRQCRGIIFSPQGDVISLPLEKFFNFGERIETLPENIRWHEPHVILEKLDGSLIRPIPMGDGKGWRLGTKAGITDVSAQAEAWIAHHDSYVQFVDACVGAHRTPIFEWCSRQQRIVIDYPEDRLVLLAIRDNQTGENVSHEDMVRLGATWGVEVVRSYDGNADTMQQLIDETRELRGQEGWVIVWADRRIKIKGDEYVSIHRAKDRLMYENDVIEMILDEKLDDVKAALPREDRERLEQFETDFWHGVNAQAKVWHMCNALVRKQYGNDRKAFALSKYENNIFGIAADDMSSYVKSAIFKAWDSKDFDWLAAVCQTIRKSLSTQAKTAAACGLWGGGRWNYGGDANEAE